MTEALALIDNFLADIRHQSIVGVDTVTDRLLDIRLAISTGTLIEEEITAEFLETSNAFWNIVKDEQA